jgi:hypothetical protein
VVFLVRKGAMAEVLTRTVLSKALEKESTLYMKH